MKAINKYVVTALELSKGYRVTLSQRMTKSRATVFKTQMEADNEAGISSNRFFADIKIEKRQPEYV